MTAIKGTDQRSPAHVWSKDMARCNGSNSHISASGATDGPAPSGAAREFRVPAARRHRSRVTLADRCCTEFVGDAVVLR